MSDKIVKVEQGAQVDAEHGVVFGWAIVCTVDGEPYFDLNVDTDGEHIGKAVPENIPDPAMLGAAIEATIAGVHLEGDEMHDGPNSGNYPFMFPLTAEIAKSLGITTTRTGLLVGYRPTPDVLAKFVNGEYTGFSMTGARLTSVEVPDA